MDGKLWGYIRTTYVVGTVHGSPCVSGWSCESESRMKYFLRTRFKILFKAPLYSL